MNEQHKINEAQYFLGRLNASRESPREFSYDLSAFLSAARSALQYALEEAKTKTGGQAWYAAMVSASSEVKFFKDKRDLSIHVAPVVPNRKINIQETVHLMMSDSLSITVYRADGTIEREIKAESPPPRSPPPSSSSVTTTYHFQDWAGQEDVEVLCRKYLSDVQAIVADGQSKGLLTL